MLDDVIDTHVLERIVALEWLIVQRGQLKEKDLTGSGLSEVKSEFETLPFQTLHFLYH